MLSKLSYPFQQIWTFLAAPNRIALAQPRALFVILSVFFGLIFLLLSAPFQAPDEYVHFYRSYEISSGRFTGTTATLPKSVLVFSQTVSKDLLGNDQNKQSKKALLVEVLRPFAEQPQVEVSVAATAIYSPLPYLPQALGIFIGRTLHLNPIFIFYLGRLCNLLAWIGLTLLAIRAAPLHPRLFAALALMPMTLHQAASNSPDAMTNAISFLFVAYALRLIVGSGAEIQWKDWAKIALLIAGLALCKSVYILLAGLLLLVPLRRFRQQRAVLPLTLAIFVLGVAFGLGWLKFASQAVDTRAMNELQTPTTAGLVYVVLHPQVAIPIFWRTAITYTGFQMRMFIGILGYLDTVLPGWVYPVYFILLFFIALFESHPTLFLSRLERLWVAFLAFAAGLLMMATFFYPEVTVGNGILGIIQGRYYIPFGPLYFLPFSQRKWSLPGTSPAWGLVGLLHILILIVTARAILWRYYAV